MIKQYALVAIFLMFGLAVVATQAIGADRTLSTDRKSAAGDVPVLKLSWELPTTRANGSPLAKSDIDHYELECQHTAMDAGAKWEIPGDVTDFPHEIDKAALFPEYGSYSCELYVVATGDYEGTLRSAPSNTVTADWEKPVSAEPKPPAKFRILNLGDTVALAWELPTERVDGAPLEPGDLDYQAIVCNGYNTGNAESLITIPVSGDGQHKIAREELFVSYGDYKCTVKVTDQVGNDSQWSEFARANWSDSEPAAVTNIMVLGETK